MCESKTPLTSQPPVPTVTVQLRFWVTSQPWARDVTSVGWDGCSRVCSMQVIDVNNRTFYLSISEIFLRFCLGIRVHWTDFDVWHPILLSVVLNNTTHNQHNCIVIKTNNDVAGYVILILTKWFWECMFLFTEILNSSCKPGMRLLFGVVLRRWIKKYREFISRDAVVEVLRNLAVVSINTCYAM
jgi:hypothetical protein